MLFILVACENEYEDTHKFLRPYYLYKDYPIYLDAREILVDIQIKPSIHPDATFKIASNDRYIFVGEKMKGIHVYEKTDEFHANPLCFIECKHLKVFDVADNILYCNNFADLLIIDAEDPLKAKIEHREKDYFNQYSYSNYNMPHIYANNIDVYQIGYKTVVLEGKESDTEPAPDFSDYDQLYTNFIVKEIPNDIQLDMPYTGITNVEENIFTFGINNLAQCSYTSDGIKITQSGINIPNYLYTLPGGNLQYKDGMIFIIGNSGFVYLDYLNMMMQSQNYYNWYQPLDVVSLKVPTNGLFIMGRSYVVDGIIIGANYGGISEIPWSVSGVTSLVNVNDTILALGNQLTLYQFYMQYTTRYTKQVKQYSNISGTSMQKDGDRLIVANRQGLSFYDIRDLKNITLIP